MKRRLREAVRLHRLAVSAAADVVINPKKSLLTADFTDLLREVERAFSVIQKAWLSPAANIRVVQKNSGCEESETWLRLIP